MSDEFTFKLDYPLTQKQIDVITDAELEHTSKIWFTTRSGKEVEFVKTPQWILCSERLPEEDGQYLITVKYVHVDGYDDIYAEHGDWADGKWDMFCFGHCGIVESVLAWMPLPKPYEGRTE